jgi:imidazolonepropionase-like amidohydrolase
MRFAAAVPVVGSADDGGGNVISIHLCESGYFIPENTRSEKLHVSARRGTLTSKKQHRAPAPHDATYHVRRQSHCARGVIKAAGAVPAPFTSYGYYNTDKFHFYGEELMRRAMAYRSFADAGITAAAGSDFSPGPFAPLMGMQGMVTRKGWNGETWGTNQRIGVDEALRVLTINGAYASHEESIKGSITPGKLADFVILADDPHTIDQDKIKDIAVVRTVTGGKTVYRA